MDFEKLYNAYYMQVYSYLMTLCGNPHTAEEITQEVFFKAMKAKHTYRCASGELTWLCAIAKNTFFDVLTGLILTAAGFIKQHGNHSKNH